MRPWGTHPCQDMWIVGTESEQGVMVNFALGKEQEEPSWKSGGGREKALVPESEVCASDAL